MLSGHRFVVGEMNNVRLSNLKGRRQFGDSQVFGRDGEVRLGDWHDVPEQAEAFRTLGPGAHGLGTTFGLTWAGIQRDIEAEVEIQTANITNVQTNFLAFHGTVKHGNHVLTHAAAGAAAPGYHPPPTTTTHYHD